MLLLFLLLNYLFIYLALLVEQAILAVKVTSNIVKHKNN